MSAVKEIPAFVFSYFDPEGGAFHTLTHPAIPLHVLPAATAQPTVAASAAPGSAAARPGDCQHQGAPRLCGAGRSALVAPARFSRLAGPRAPGLGLRPALAASKGPAWPTTPACAAAARSRAWCIKAWPIFPPCARAHDAEAFYATVFRLLQEQLGERLDLPASAITEAVLEEARGKGLSEPTETLLRELFHACNQFRYTPEHTAQELASLIPKVKTALHELQKMTPPAAAPVGKNLLQGAGLAPAALGGGRRARR